MGSSIKAARRMAICERDGWQCQMPRCWCPFGRAIDSALFKVNGPWMPTVDHIVPRAEGGNSDNNNLRAAHQMCNVAGAAKMGRERNRVMNPPKRKPRRTRKPLPPLTYGIGDVFPGNQGSGWS